MAGTSENWTLSIDFGTTNTAAAVSVEGRHHQSIALGSSSTVMPSGVACSGDGSLLVGETARHAMGALPPGSYEPTPKRVLGDGEVLLGGRRLADVDLVAEVLRTVAQRAARTFNDRPCEQLRLTYPAVWAEPRRQLLRDAAARAGVPEPMLVSEPVAAATYYAKAHPTGSDGPVAVYDLGGGTLDVAVLRPVGDTYEVLAVDGVDPLGGETFDEQLLQFVRGHLIARGRENLWERLQARGAAGAQRTVKDSVRSAKHALSELASADIAIAVGDDSEVIRVTRDEFNARIRTELDTTITTLRNALSLARVQPEQLSRLYLVGGSTYIPAVAQTITQELGVSPATYDDPKTVTSLGALAVPAEATVEHTPVAGQPAPPPFEDHAVVEEKIVLRDEVVGEPTPEPVQPQSWPRVDVRSGVVPTVVAAALALLALPLAGGERDYVDDGLLMLGTACIAAVAAVVSERTSLRWARILCGILLLVAGAFGLLWVQFTLTEIDGGFRFFAVVPGLLLVWSAIVAATSFLRRSKQDVAP